MKLTQRAIRWAAVLALAASAPSATAAAEASCDVTKSREVTVGNLRVVLLRVSEAVDFPGDPKKPAAKSLEAWVLVEVLDDAKGAPEAKGLEALAANSNQPAVQFLTDVKWSAASGTYEEQEKGKYGPTKLPEVKARDRAFVLLLMIPSIELTAKRVDLKMQVGLPKNEEHVVWFKGISFVKE